MGFNESHPRAPPRRAQRARRAHPLRRPPRLAGAQAAPAPAWTRPIGADRRTTARMTFTIAFNYGGRAEIVDAVRALVADGRAGRQDRREGDPAATSTTPTCPTPTWWSAPRASSASPTSCCGSWPTASWCSPTCCGPTSGASTSSTPCASSSAATAASGAVGAGADGVSTATTGVVLRTYQAGRGRPHRRARHRAATARCGPWPRACARPRAASAAASSR